MFKTSVKWIEQKNGIRGILSGTISNIIVSKNGVIRLTSEFIKKNHNKVL